LSLALRTTSLAAMLLVPVAVGLCALRPPFPSKIPLTLLFCVLVAEKVWSMLFRMRQRFRPDVQKDWTSVSVGLSYTLVFYFALVEFYVRRAPPAIAWAAVLGAATYAWAVFLRYWAFRCLGHQWAIHVDETIEDRSLVTRGPYGAIRHPLYTGACMETLGLPLILGAYWTLLFAAVVFVPIEVQRAYFEERYLRRIFGGDYDAYAGRTWAFVPLPFGKRRAPGGTDDGP
jgi:protein-S-isoprenylcysteine O-methyltransferase Ste14